MGIMKYVCSIKLDIKAFDDQTYTEYKGNFIQDFKEGTCTIEFCDGSRFHG